MKENTPFYIVYADNPEYHNRLPMAFSEMAPIMEQAKEDRGTVESISDDIIQVTVDGNIAYLVTGRDNGEVDAALDAAGIALTL